MPVYRGAEAPLQIAHHPSPVFVHGADGFGDIGVTAEFDGEPAPGHAADRIVDLVRNHPHQVTLLAIGPLTNLALALERAPEIVNLVKEVSRVPYLVASAACSCTMSVA